MQEEVVIPAAVLTLLREMPRQLGAVALPSAAVHAAVLTLRDLAGRILALKCPRAGHVQPMSTR